MNISTDGESAILTGLTFINVTRKKSKKPKKKKTNINKTREHLLILINNELITHLHEKSPSKVNHKTLADIEKEHNVHIQTILLKQPLLQILYIHTVLYY